MLICDSFLFYPWEIVFSSTAKNSSVIQDRHKEPRIFPSLVMLNTNIHRIFGVNSYIKELGFEFFWKQGKDPLFTIAITVRFLPSSHTLQIRRIHYYQFTRRRGRRMMTTRIAQLATCIQHRTLDIDSYLKQNQLASPSFDEDILQQRYSSHSSVGFMSYSRAPWSPSGASSLFMFSNMLFSNIT